MCDACLKVDGEGSSTISGVQVGALTDGDGRFCNGDVAVASNLYYRAFHVSLPHYFTHRDTTKVTKCFRSLSDLVALNIGQIGENLALGNATVVNAAEGEAICGLCHPRFIYIVLNVLCPAI